MTNLTARPDAGPGRCSQPAPRITTAKTPALPAAASSASTRSSRNGAISGYRRAGGTTAGRSDRDHRTPARAIARARRSPAGRRPADPVNEIVTPETAASAGPLRRRRRCSPAPGSTWHFGWRTRTTRPHQRPGQDKNERHQEQAHAGLLLGPAAHPGSTGTIILRSSTLRVLHGSLRWVTSRDEPGLTGPASPRTGIPARARHHQSR